MTTILRRSALEASSCLRRFHAVYELGLEDESDESRRGSIFHHIALERYIPALVRRNLPSDLDELDRAFREGIVASQCPPHLVDELEDLIFKWGQHFELDLAAFLVAEEQQVTGSVSWKPDLVFAWRNTPRGSVLRVEDLKTYYGILNEDAVRRTLQAQLYTRNAMRTWPGFDVFEFAMTFVRFGVSTVIEFPEDELASLDRKVEAILAMIDDARARQAWPAQPGAHCAFCRLTCDAADDPRVLDRRILTGEEAGIVASRLTVLDRLKKADHAALKAWAMLHGPVRIEGLEYAHRPTVRERYDAKGVFLALDRHEAPAPPGLAFSKSALSKLLTKKAARAWPGLAETLTTYQETTTSTRFSAKKVGDVAPELDGDEAAEE